MIVYVVTNTVSGSKYVGMTTKALNVRWNQHTHAARSGKDTRLYRALRKYGPDVFTREVVATAASVQELKQLECEAIARLRTFARGGTGYNLTLGGEGMDNMNAPKGEANHRAVLTEAIVRFIRDPDLSGVSNRQLAIDVDQKFGRTIAMDTIKNARNGKTWAHLDIPPVKTMRGARKPPLTEAQKAERRRHLDTIRPAAVAKAGDLSRGKRGHNGKLTEDQIRSIFFADGPGTQIAARFGVHKKVVYGIKGRTMHPYLTRTL